ncbi:hypothetical protein ColLi_06470 [Colletotrichum liriopes]|uniref:Uncharacterized protein n=1 Tax=Colletotrichum liriopes TaxID=708192 RepID=A0AA37GMS4_9PEZI|nr:hypothetical protein ColLi_06470 [Colletotrichum liriopes]
MSNFGNVGKRSGADADGRGKRQRLDPTQGDANTRTTLPTERLTQTWRQAPGANFGFGVSASRAEQQNLVDDHRARTAAAVTDPASLYRQGREAPLGPGPIVNGEPTYPVCEKCRQANIRQQVLQGIAAQALVALSQRVAAHRPRHNDQAEDVRGQACNGIGPVPKTPQLFLCLRCKRPGVPLAPGRRRCTECICILVAFGPDEDEEQSDANGNQKLQKQQPAGLQSQQQPPDQRWHMCDGCFKKPVPPGERKCQDCVVRSAPKGRTVDLCVICENNVVVQGQSYCGNCEIEGTRGLNASAMDDVMQCNACGDYADRTADGICWDCRMLDASSTAAAYKGHGAVLDEWDLMDTSEDGPSEPQQLIEKRCLWMDRMEEKQLAQESPEKC